jgi:hypothetical protein
MIMKRFALLLTMALVLLASGGWGAAEEPSFSRSRWLEAQEAWGARVPENLVPEDPRRLQAFLDKVAATRPPSGGIPKGVVRLSSDLLNPITGPSQGETETEPFFAVDPESPAHLLAGYQEDRFLDEGCRSLTSTVTFNGGRTWQETLLPDLTVANGGPYERTSDPWVTFGPGGKAYFVSLGFNETKAQNGVYVSASDDGGVTWGDPVAVHSSTQVMDDKEAIVVDTRNDSPYKGRVYVGWDWIAQTGEQPELVSYSDDGGRSFQSPVTITNQGFSIGIVPLVGPGGIVHAVWLNFTQQVTMQTAHSTDGGRTWSAPVTIARVWAVGVPGSRTAAGIPSAAVDARTGALYVVWQDQRFTPGVDQAVIASSTDGGQTWSAPQKASDGPGGSPNFTPAVAVSPEGLVGVSYYSFRNDRSGVLVDEYLAVSRSGGQHFGKSLRVSPTSWDLRYAATSDGFFLGDYQGIAAISQTFYPLWIATYAPSRFNSLVRQPDVFTRMMKVR